MELKREVHGYEEDLNDVSSIYSQVSEVQTSETTHRDPACSHSNRHTRDGHVSKRRAEEQQAIFDV
ncbi:hypothetical protein EYF80_007241 [Liparis tanakae]|uniref:Uncharacterized protein n=1 Tax=Liparis tanakae TaxID=230148 RepID=A0A4Z2IX04_9TELE|nr:hypothetical protein EYF80_007241 [Liparis tanakae]